MAVDPLSQPLFRCTPEVEDALAERRPLVALESTLLAHGLPVDRRAQVAAELEAVVRAEGAVPATIAILDGYFHLGLGGPELERVIAGDAQKASLRDLSVALGLGGVWATTVASTMAIAARAGIRVFATGGIGGVHRDVSETSDESADLYALARYPVATVSAGAKSVLDLPRTLERLETLGVPVIGYQTQELPAFYHGQSGLPLVARADTVEALARVLVARFDRLQEGGLLVVQPPPGEVAQTPERVDALITRALSEAAQAGVRGRAVTPYLLARLDALSGGDVVRTNIALVKNNAQLAARLAVAEVALTAAEVTPGD